MLKRLRLALVLLLATAVVFANPGTAAASTTTGVMSFAFGFPEYANCQLPWAVTSTGLSVGASSRCDGRPDTSPFYCQAFEGDCGSYGLVVKGPQGETCGSAAMEPFDVAGNDTRSVAAGLGAAFIPITFTSCEPVEACLSLYISGFGGTDSAVCVPLDVTAPDAPGTGAACPIGTPYARLQTTREDHPQFGAPNNLDTTRLLLNVSGAGPTTGSWSAAVRGWGANFNLTNLTSSTIVSQNLSYGNAALSGPPPGTMIEIYATYVGSWNEGPPDVRAMEIANVLPPGRYSNYLGWTDPEHCRFYFGPKIVDSPTLSGDEPAGDGQAPYVEPVPVDTDPPVVIEPTDDQPTDELSLWGAILAVLRSIWNAISGVVSGFLAGLRNLFVPNGDGWDIADTRDQLKTKPPFSVANQFIVQGGNFSDAYSGAGDCGVLMTFGDSQLNCSTIRATPGIGGLYNLVAAGLIGLTLLGAFRMVHRTFEAAS